MSERSIEVSGKTEEDAIQSALRQLGLDRDEVSVELLERAKSGFLGIGASPALIRVTYTVEDEPVEPPTVKPETAVSSPSEPSPTPAAQVNEPAPALLGSPEEKAEQFISGLLERMGTPAEISITQQDGTLRIVLSGRNMGALIGRRGETLDAIQHLTNYTINRGAEKRTRVNIDAENYRQKREETLIRLAQKVAGKVVRYRKNMSLEPMNSYERHVIHTALQDFDNVTTYSTGNEPNRRVVVAYDRSKTSSNTHREWS